MTDHRPGAPEGPRGGLSDQSIAWIVGVGLSVLAILVTPHFGASAAVPSASVIALGFGILLGAIPTVRQRLGTAAKKVSKDIIPIAIVMIGFGLDLGPLVKSGSILIGFAVVVICMVVAFAGAYVGGRVMGLDPRAALLLGAGTAVCGNSAIMAVAPTVGAEDDDLGLSIGVINFLGIVMVFALPPLAVAVGLDAAAGGALAGLTVHALPQAIATGESIGGEEIATTYKLVRVAMLLPVAFLMAFALTKVRGRDAVDQPKKGRAIPMFMWFFVLAAAVRAAGLVDGQLDLFGGEPKPIWGWAKLVGKAALGVALATIGLGLDMGKLVRVGPRVLVAGLIAVSAMVAIAIPLVRLL